MNAKDLAGYSLTRALRGVLAETFHKSGGLELEAHQEMKRQAGPEWVPHDPNGILVPTEAIRTALNQRAQYLVGTAAQGGNLVETGFYIGIIQLLRNRSAAVDMGALVVEGLVGQVAVPKWNGTITPSWLAEGGAVADSEGVIAQVASSPKTIAARSTLSRLLLLQSTPSIDQLVTIDLMRGLGVALDNAAFNGTGTTGQPTGVLNAGITTASGAALAYSVLIGMQTSVLAANGVTDPNATGFVCPAAVAGLLAQKATGTLNWPMWDYDDALRDGNINGARAISSEQIPAQTLLFGDFSNLMILQWGPGLEVAVNPYQGFAAGDVGIRGFLSADIVVRHAESFSKLTGIT